MRRALGSLVPVAAVLGAAGCASPAAPLSATPRAAEPAQPIAVAPAPVQVAEEGEPPVTGDGGAWHVESNPSSGFDIPSALVVTEAGIYVVGYEGVGGPWRLERRRAADGALISVARTERGTHWGVRDMIARGDDLFLAGDTRVEKRAVADGSLVTRFGDGGEITVEAVIHAIEADADAIYVIGETDGGLWIQKRDRGDGALISSFADGGTWKATAGGGSNFLLSGVLHGDHLITGGFQAAGNQLGRIDCLDRDSGATVRGFADGGTVVIGSEWGGVQRVERVGVADGSLFTFVSDAKVGHDSQWRMERRSPRDGSIVWERVLNLNPAADERATRRNGSRPVGVYDGTGDMAVDSEGVVYVGTGAGTHWQIVEMTLDGELVRSRAIDPSSGRDEAHAVALDGPWVYVAGFVEVEGQDMAWRIQRLPRSAAADR